MEIGLRNGRRGLARLLEPVRSWRLRVLMEIRDRAQTSADSSYQRLACTIERKVWCQGGLSTMRGTLISRRMFLALALTWAHAACRDDPAQAEWRQNFHAACDPGVGCPRGWSCVVEEMSQPADSDSPIRGIAISYCMKTCATNADCKPYKDSAQCLRDINGRTFVCSAE